MSKYVRRWQFRHVTGGDLDSLYEFLVGGLLKLRTSAISPDSHGKI